MPNTIPLASSGILFGEHSDPNGHSTGGVFELELESIGQSRSAGGDQDAYTI